VSVTLGSETRSEDETSTSLSGFVIRDDDPSLLEEATSALRLERIQETDAERARRLSARMRSIDEEMAEALLSLRDPTRRSRAR
jgi:hypothetical protein